MVIKIKLDSDPGLQKCLFWGTFAYESRIPQSYLLYELKQRIASGFTLILINVPALVTRVALITPIRVHGERGSLRSDESCAIFEDFNGMGRLEDRQCLDGKKKLSPGLPYRKHLCNLDSTLFNSNEEGNIMLTL